jgi:hypothetical protein
MLKPFHTLPPSSRLWIFAADRMLSPSEIATANAYMTNFLTSWKAHGADVEAGFELQHSRFLLVASTNAMADPSGCSIDAMTRAVRELGQQLGVNFMPGANIYYMSGSAVEAVDRPTFKQLAKQGTIGDQTTVFNTMVTSIEEMQSGKWQLPAGESWHRQLIG